jgi:DMSO reductase iron-sulfur subunit
MSDTPHYGMVIDTGRCIGCQTCVVSCKLSNEVPGEEFWSAVESLDGERIYQSTGKFPKTVLAFRPRLCNHCASPSCVANCPTGAMHKDAQTGVVLVDQDICIGCGYCKMVCPYDAPVMDTEHGVMSKCTFCKARVAEGVPPYCVKSCPAKARVFGDLDDPQSEIAALIQQKHGERFMPEYGTEPSVLYV